MFVILLLTSLIVFSEAPLRAQEMIQWKDVSQGIGESEILSIGVAPWNSGEIYAGTNSGIYQTLDHGTHWKKVLAIKGDDRAVYCISFGGHGSSSIYGATGNGVYRSTDSGRNWKQVFRPEGSDKRTVFWIEPVGDHPEQLYAGTIDGVFSTKDEGKKWQKIDAPIKNQAVHRMVTHPNGSSLWLATDSGIFFSADQGYSWERIWISPSQSSEEEVTVLETPEELELFSSEQRVNHLLLQPNGKEKMRLLVGTSLGLFTQRDNSNHWESVPPTGMNLPEIRFMTFDPKREGAVFLGTSRGVYYWDGQTHHWEGLTVGMLGRRVNELEFERSGTQLWAATDQGIYFAEFSSPSFLVEQSLEKPNFLTTQEILSRYRHEPAIEQVQQWAIRYAEVHPEKIQQWRQQAKTRAYLPEISFTMNRDRNRTIDLDRGGTNDPDRYIIGPDDKSFDMDVAISWDLANLIWNDDQTSIDVRSRLMVQLRDDILDEVTRLYFERRRLQVEEELSPAHDVQLQLTRELRLEELTAQIDALTGGEFSRFLVRSAKQE